MSSAAAMAGALSAMGGGLLVSGMRWFRRPPLGARLAPYLSARSTGEIATRAQGHDPGEASSSGFLSRLLERPGLRLPGSNDQLAARLAQAGLSEDAAAFRTRQFGLGVVAFLAAVAAVITLGLPALVAAITLCGVPLLCGFAMEQHLASRIAARQATLLEALPVTVEQLSLLIGAGYSLSSALTRLAERSTGVVADSLGAVVRRIRQGRSEVDSLREWADDCELPQVQRLVGVLALHREAGDLAALLSAEAESVRAEAHRNLIATIERRGQLVWVPVTVATLVPGLILLAVPFLSAVAMVTGG